MNPSVILRPVNAGDLSIFFAQGQDPEAVHMAAFTARDPSDRAAFDAHWARIVADEGITLRTIVYRGQVAGYILCHGWFGEPEMSYWLGRAFWGQGIATAALRAFLAEVPARPLYAHAAADNVASIRVLEKAGFTAAGRDRGFANARGEEIDEVIYVVNG